MDALPALLQGHGMIRDEVSAGGAAVAVAVIVEPLHAGPGPVFSQQGLVEGFLLFFGEA